MTHDRSELRKSLDRDGIEFLLVQFVDMHGAAKAKMVPAARSKSSRDPQDKRWHLQSPGNTGTIAG